MAIGQYLGGTSGGQVGIRRFLNDQGYNDNDIGYNNGTVTLRGRSFMNVTPQADGSTYASPTALQSALQGFNASGRNSTLNNTLDNLGTNVNAKPFEFKQQQQPFSYDPNNDQAYQAALKSAQFNIQQSQGNTLANLLAHGQGNSSYAATAAQQIANQGMNNVSQNILPQLIQQAYQRYQDQNNNDYRNQMANYNAGQDQMKNQSALASTLNGLNQQDFQNELQTADRTGYLNGQQTLAGQNQLASLTGYVDPYAGIRSQMAQNSAAWANASPEEQARLHQANLDLAKQAGGTYDEATGEYNLPASMRTLGGQQVDIARQNAASLEQERKDMGAYRNAEAARQYALANGQIGLARQGNTIAQQRLDQENQARDVESQVMDHAQEFQSPQDVEDYFRANGAYLTKELGAKATNDLKNSFLSPFNQDNKQSTSTYDRAFAAAQRDGDWMGLSPDEQNARVNKYLQMLQNKGQ